MLRAYLGVVKPSMLKNPQEIVSGVQYWEAKVGTLKSRHGEDVSGRLKAAIVIGMLPQEAQDKVLQTFAQYGPLGLKFEAVRDFIINWATNKSQWTKPSAEVDTLGNEGYGGYQDWPGYGYYDDVPYYSGDWEPLEGWG